MSSPLNSLFWSTQPQLLSHISFSWGLTCDMQLNPWGVENSHLDKNLTFPDGWNFPLSASWKYYMKKNTEILGVKEIFGWQFPWKNSDFPDFSRWVVTLHNSNQNLALLLSSLATTCPHASPKHVLIGCTHDMPGSQTFEVLQPLSKPKQTIYKIPFI